ncbi:MAG TPA: hypothetical protein VEC38_11010 [Candidatus Binataceae bacterium]|nr:hypothetical protein [Candidatus Binataceae bacterium]
MAAGPARNDSCSADRRDNRYLIMAPRVPFGVWQRKQHRYRGGSSIWHHLRLAPGIAVNVWTMDGLGHYVIEFHSVTERAPNGEAAAKRAALELAGRLCRQASSCARRLLSHPPSPST